MIRKRQTSKKEFDPFSGVSLHTIRKSDKVWLRQRVDLILTFADDGGEYLLLLFPRFSRYFFGSAVFLNNYTVLLIVSFHSP